MYSWEYWEGKEFDCAAALQQPLVQQLQASCLTRLKSRPIA